MRLRTATTRDLHRCAVISTTSLVDDATYDYLWPHRRRYPEDNFTWMQFRLQKLLYDKRAIFLVVEIDGDTILPNDKKTPPGVASTQPSLAGSNGARTRHLEEPESTVIAYGIWIIKGHGAEARSRIKAKNTWMNMLDATTSAVQVWSTEQKYERRDGCKARHEAVEAATKEVEARYFPTTADWWSLELLVTDRPYRRHGAATELVRWGMHAAATAGICCAVEASEMGSKLYVSLGFDKLTAWVVHVPGDRESLSYDVLRLPPVAGVTLLPQDEDAVPWGLVKEG